MANKSLIKVQARRTIILQYFNISRTNKCIMAKTNLTVMKRNEEVGRYLVAKQDLEAGDLILEDTPFGYGPKSDTKPVCLGCYKLVNCLNLCPECFWPICGMNCKFLQTHNDNECEFFSSCGVKFQKNQNPQDVCLQYECITPLRILLAKERDPQRWLEVEKLEAHNETRQNLPIWNFNQINIVDYLRGPCGLAHIPEILIHTICGILEVNSFEAKTSSGYTIRCLYPKLSILSHSCVPNLHHTINPETFDISIRASVKIPQKGELFCSYTYPLWPTLIRRDFLKQSKFFECNCKRCQDETELGTHMGTLKCYNCDNGFLSSRHPLSLDCDWKCNYCSFTKDTNSIKKLYDLVQKEIDLADRMYGLEGIKYKEVILNSFQSIFHDNHSFMTILKLSLCNLYGEHDGFQERKIKLCRDILEVLDVVEPGMTRIRALTLYELHLPLLKLTKSKYKSGKLKREEFLHEMKNAAKILEECVGILQYEFPNSKEGKLGLLAVNSYEKLKKILLISS